MQDIMTFLDDKSEHLPLFSLSQFLFRIQENQIDIYLICGANSSPTDRYAFLGTF